MSSALDTSGSDLEKIKETLKRHTPVLMRFITGEQFWPWQAEYFYKNNEDKLIK